MTLVRWKDALDAFKIVVESKTASSGMKALAFEGQGDIFARNETGVWVAHS